MKALELHQMEEIEGGDLTGCLGGYATTIALLSSVAVLSGPVGWIAVAGYAAGGFAAGLTIGSECM